MALGTFASKKYRSQKQSLTKSDELSVQVQNYMHVEVGSGDAMSSDTNDLKERLNPDFKSGSNLEPEV